MRKKYALSFFIIIGLSLSKMIIRVPGVTTYTCNVKAGDQNILELLEIDEYYSRYMVHELGNKRKLQVSIVTEETNSFHIQLNIWDTTPAKESFNTNPDFTYTFIISKDPTKQLMHPPIVLSPINTYLSEFALRSTEYYNYTSNGNKLAMHYWPDSYTNIFGSNGLLSGIEITNNTAMLERWGIKEQSSEIPRYDLPIVIGLGLTIIAVLSLIYLWKKKVWNKKSLQ